MAPEASFRFDYRPCVNTRKVRDVAAKAREFHFHGRRPFYPRRAIRDERFKLIHTLRAGLTKLGPGIDGDPAYKQSRTAAFADTGIQRAFNTFADPPEFELHDDFAQRPHRI